MTRHDKRTQARIMALTMPVCDIANLLDLPLSTVYRMIDRPRKISVATYLALPLERKKQLFISSQVMSEKQFREKYSVTTRTYRLIRSRTHVLA